MPNVNDDEIRSLNNRLSDLRVRMADAKADLQRLQRKQEEHQLRIRRLTKEIQRKKMELDEMKQMEKKFAQEEFGLKEERRLLEKKIEEVMAQKRLLEHI
jgi:chromosome segregation ATPase